MSQSLISEKEVRHIAELAKLELTDQEIFLYQKQLSEILQYVKQLEEVDVFGVETVYSIPNYVNVWNEDKVEKSLTQDQALENATWVKNGFFKVRKVLKDFV